MPVSLTAGQIVLRIALALLASFLIGYDRDEQGKTSGIRTTMLVCLAATLAMLQANLLMNTTGKASSSFITLDPMRLPLGILSGIGFIGAGAILRKDGLVHGLTTAATIWYVTVLGLLFGGGQLRLAIAGSVIALLILWALKHFEKHISTQRTGTLSVEFNADASPSPDSDLRDMLHRAGFSVSRWTSLYAGSSLQVITCELRWSSNLGEEPSTPAVIHELGASPSIIALTWKA
jgi:putative Mg2+ transporter-C (MgtC) family protein